MVRPKHARHAALRDDDVVDGTALVALPAVVDDVAREHEPFLDTVLFVEDLLQLRLDLIELDVDEEADRAEVDAADGDGLLVDAAADVQKRAVAADGMTVDVLDAVLLVP